MNKIVLFIINFANLKYKKGHNSGKNCRKIIIIELDIDTQKIHLHTTHGSTKKGHNSGKNCQKLLL
jgi:phosphoribosyl-AMP cyclohydrolase